MTELARTMNPPDDEVAAHLATQPKFARLAPSTLRAAWWAMRSVRRARRDLRTIGLDARVAPPPAVPWGARTGVLGVLQRLEPTCLEGAVVMQAWLHAHGVHREVVVGVATPGEDGLRAHAWVDGLASAEEQAAYRVIHRIVPR